MNKSLALGAGSLIAPSLLNMQSAQAESLRIRKNDISIAQWALVDEIRAGKWKTLDFPRIAREDFGLNGIEFVNTLFEVPTFNYLKELKKNAEDQGVKMVLIMVDNEGETCTPSKEERKQTVINHQKWIDIAHYLGCHSIRTNFLFFSLELSPSIFQYPINFDGPCFLAQATIFICVGNLSTLF